MCVQVLLGSLEYLTEGWINAIEVCAQGLFEQTPVLFKLSWHTFVTHSPSTAPGTPLTLLVPLSASVNGSSTRRQLL